MEQCKKVARTRKRIFTNFISFRFNLYNRILIVASKARRVRKRSVGLVFPPKDALSLAFNSEMVFGVQNKDIKKFLTVSVLETILG